MVLLPAQKLGQIIIGFAAPGGSSAQIVLLAFFPENCRGTVSFELQEFQVLPLSKNSEGRENVSGEIQVLNLCSCMHSFRLFDRNGDFHRFQAVIVAIFSVSTNSRGRAPQAVALANVFRSPFSLHLHRKQNFLMSTNFRKRAPQAVALANFFRAPFCPDFLVSTNSRGRAPQAVALANFFRALFCCTLTKNKIFCNPPISGGRGLQAVALANFFRAPFCFNQN